MLNQLIKFLKILNGDVAPGQIAAGLCFGMLIVFTPFWSLHTVLVLLLICILRINISAVFLAMAFFALFAWFLDPYFIQVGEYILTNPDWVNVWTAMYQQDIWRLAHFNNTLTMGSISVSLALFLPLFFVFRFLVIKYRVKFMEKLNQLKLVRWLKTSKYGVMIFDTVAGA